MGAGDRIAKKLICMSGLFLEYTPIERFLVRKRVVFVKRDDLFGRPPAPPLGKLRGLRAVMHELNERGARLVGCWDTRVSRLGEGLAAIVRQYPRMKAMVCYPRRIGLPVPTPVVRAADLGASIVAFRGNHLSICFSQAKKKVESCGGIMLPFGLDCREAVLGVAAEAARLPRELSGGTIVLCCGSGVTLAGLLAGLNGSSCHVIGVSSGRSLSKIWSCVRKHVPVSKCHVELIEALMPYDSLSTVECPFPSHPNYDRKAWQYLTENITTFKDPILFWNIGS
jgi:hypothetical protein